MDNLKARYPEQYAAPLAVIDVTGDDRKTFLQGQFSCDLDKLSPGMMTPGLYCNRQGRILANFLVLERSDRIQLILDRSLVDSLIETLKHYGLFSKVEFAVQTHALSFSLSDDTEAKPEFGEQANGDIQLCLARYTLTLHAEDTELHLNEHLWAFSNIISKQPQITAETSEKFLPHRLGFHETDHISFNKGCYLGQEIIARMHYKSEHKHALFHVTTEQIDDTLKAGVKIKTTPESDTLEVINLARINNVTHLLVSFDKQAVHSGKGDLNGLLLNLKWELND